MKEYNLNLYSFVPSVYPKSQFEEMSILIETNQYDTIYHEHYSYLSLISAQNVLRKAKLKIIDIEEIKPHGGSYRIIATHAENKIKKNTNVDKILNKEKKFGINKIRTYKN